jgi:6-phosphogluconolactonase
VQTRPGSGPRHITFHPSRPFAYLVEEISGTVSAYRYQNGRLILLQNISSQPANYKGEKGSADIHVSPDGKFLYASNRGDANSIAVYVIEQSLGMLRLKGFQSTLGKTPRNFVIDPTGRYLLVANQDTDNVVIFRRNPETGLLQPTGKQINIPNPVCLIMIKK